MCGRAGRILQQSPSTLSHGWCLVVVDYGGWGPYAVDCDSMAVKIDRRRGRVKYLAPRSFRRAFVDTGGGAAGILTGFGHRLDVGGV